MSKTKEILFGDGEHKFRLALGELRELQEKCCAGPATILARLMAIQPQAADARRPHPSGYVLGDNDPDYFADLNLYGLLRGIGGDWRVDDVRETIRLGLIGAGTSPTDAFILISRYVDPRPLSENIGVASEILVHALIGDPDDPVGKGKAVKSKTKAKTA